MTTARREQRPLRLGSRLVHAARQVARDPDRLPWALRHLLDDALISWHPARPRERADAPMDVRLVLTDPEGGTLTADRAAPAFSTREQLAALALMSLARVRLATTRRPPARRLELPTGERIILRTATADDPRAMAALSRSAALTGSAGPASLLPSRRGRGLLALTPEGRTVGCAGVFWDGPGAELSLFLADGWWPRGLGEALLRELADLASAAGVSEVWVHTPCDDVTVRAAVRRVFPRVDVDSDGAGTTLTIALGPLRS